MTGKSKSTSRKCAVCGHPVDAFDICEICGWQDDDVLVHCPDTLMGPNDMTLNEARKAYQLKQQTKE